MASEVLHRAGYDLSSWQGIAKLLADARTKLSASAYHSFYDTVTAYSRSRGTDTVRLAEIEKTVGGWGGASVPSASMPQSAPRETRIDPAPGVAETDAEADAVIAAAIAEAEHAPAVSPTPRETPVPAAPVAPPQPAVEDRTEERHITIDEARVRIADIKHDVHELVGNPAVLVGSLGSVGKRYMQALLKATRATLGGAGGGLTPAMRDLEEVYEALRIAAHSGLAPGDLEKEDMAENVSEEVKPVQDDARKDESKPDEEIPSRTPPEVLDTIVVDEAPEVVASEVDAPVSMPVIEIPQDVQDDGVPEDTHPRQSEVGAPQDKNLETPSRSEVAAKESSMPMNTAPRAIRRTQPRFRPSGTPPEKRGDEDLDMLRARLAALEQKLDRTDDHDRQVGAIDSTGLHPEEVSSKPEETPPTSSRNEEDSVHADVQPTNVARADNAATDDAAPLHVLKPTFAILKKDPELEYGTQAVTNGLESLLMSWEIFRGGLLSGKARGVNHPLYQAVREKPMSDALAGKFPGAKTQAVISINDYVNAWRFEQGIEYNPLETFEHYLRRVVHRILSRAGEI